MREKRKNIVLEEVEIVDAGAEGKGVGKKDGLVVFVPYTAPGDVVDVLVYNKRKSFAEGRILKIHKLSEMRSEPFCPHFGLCGGCKWQHLSYKDQLSFKQKIVKDNFERIGWLEIGEFRSIMGSEASTHYRNKLEFTFSKRRWFEEPPPTDASQKHDSRALGFHMPSMFDRIIDIRQCFLQQDPSNAIRTQAKQIAIDMGLDFYDTREHQGFFRNLIIRTTTDGQVMVIIIVGLDDQDQVKAFLNRLLESVPEISSAYFAINQKKNDAIYDLDFIHHHGESFIEEAIEGIRFRIGPKSFFQTNTSQAKHLYQTAREFSGLNEESVVYDLYCGAGTISLFVAKHAKRVLGIESVRDAVDDAINNANLNGIGNVEFVAGDLGRMFDSKFIESHGRPDVVITDPPRAGMQPKVLNTLLELAAPRIVYVSCNPATQARDCAILAKKYDVQIVQPVDMFPQTQHVENVALLTLRPSIA